MSISTVLLPVFSENFSADNYVVPGYIQIKSEPDVDVYLNNELKGKTRRERGGLILQDVKPGEYVIDLKKTGYISQQDTCLIYPAQVYSFEARPFKTYMEAATSIEVEDNASGLGQLVIQSLPVECSITIADLHVTSEMKVYDEWVRSSLPSGTYEAELSAVGKTLSYPIRIQPRRETRLLFNFLEDEIIDVGEFIRLQTQKEQLYLQQQRQDKVIARFSEERRRWEDGINKAAKKHRHHAFKRRLLLLLEHAENEYRYILGRRLYVTTGGEKIFDVNYSMGEMYPFCNYELVEHYGGDWSFYCKIVKDASPDVVGTTFDSIMKEMEILDPPEWKLTILDTNRYGEPGAVEIANEADQLRVVFSISQNSKGNWDLDFAIESLELDDDLLQLPSNLGDISTGTD